MNELLNQTIEFEPAPLDLCLKCGRCCKTITSIYPHSKVTEMANNNEEEAKVFVNVFKPYANIYEAEKADPEHIGQIIERRKSNKNSLTFYYCPYLSDDNACTIYSQRPDCCRRAPINGWSLFPPRCGYEGWQFEQREKHKKHVRKLKEVLYELELLASDDKQISSGQSVKDLKKRIKNKIIEYDKFGSANW